MLRHVAEDAEIRAPIVKLITAWIFAVFSSLWTTFQGIPWDKLAQFAAFLYSLCLIYEYLSKRYRSKKDGTN